jgi:putative transposase
MHLIRTASIKLKVDDQLSETLLKTINLYTNAYNFCCEIAFNNNLISNGITLHKLTYPTTREYLPSQYAISARDCAVSSIKQLKTKIKQNIQQRKYLKNKDKKPFSPKCPHSKLQAIRLDSHSYTFWQEKALLSLSTCNGRVKIPLQYHENFSKYKNWKHSSATLKFRNGNFYLNIQFQTDITDIPKNNKYIGIDRGINKLAVTSDNRFFLGGKTKQVCAKYLRERKILQKVGTRSAKRHLCRLSGKEHRFKADINHQISKQIINPLIPGTTIVLENLTGIRDNRTSKKLRSAINSWNYYQLEQFLKYKAESKGISIEYVDARYTSQRCSCCGFISRSNRKSQSDFRCKECGFELNADLNAARNIVSKHLIATNSPQENLLGESGRAAVNQPCNLADCLAAKVRSKKVWRPKAARTSLQARPVGS